MFLCVCVCPRARVTQAAVAHIARGMMMGCIPITSRTPYSALNETTWPFDLGPPPAAGAGREAPGAGSCQLFSVCTFGLPTLCWRVSEGARTRVSE